MARCLYRALSSFLERVMSFWGHEPPPHKQASLSSHFGNAMNNGVLRRGLVILGVILVGHLVPYTIQFNSFNGFGPSRVVEGL